MSSVIVFWRARPYSSPSPPWSPGMGISKEQAAQNRAAIIAAAERLFRDRGVDSVGVNELMDAAGFTRGGFYNHFKSKDALVAAVIDQAMTGGAATLEALRAGA